MSLSATAHHFDDSNEVHARCGFGVNNKRLNVLTLHADIFVAGTFLFM